PDDPGNKVLRLVASGGTGHMHNQIETTLIRPARNNLNYEISFRAKWVSGSNQLHTRLYFNRLPQVTFIDRPQHVGTPSAPNSSAETNIGPSITGTTHSPAVPDINQPVIVTARADDPDTVSDVQLFYSVNGAGFLNIPMATNADGTYQASVPGQSAATVVQFYIQASDRLGATATFPAAGPASRALYKVDDGLAATNGQHNFRIVVTNAERDFLHEPIEVMSNGRIGSTIIDREQDIYYDVQLRLKGSERARFQRNRVGYNMRFGADQLYRGIHSSLAIDRSEGVGQGQIEILFDFMIANSGGVVSRYYDFIKVLAPKNEHTRSAVLQMARYDNVFLDSQFEDGSDGNLYEYELLYTPNNADRNGFKLPNSDGVTGVTVSDLGDDKEKYRWFFLKKNNREADDFDPIIAYNKKFSQSGDAFENGLEDVVDIDGWFRGMAYAVLSGAGDNAGANSQHNGMYYAHPDGRVMFLPHDMDFAFDASRSVFANSQCSKLTRDGARRRIYLGHLHDIITTTYNNAYMALWTRHLQSFDRSQNWSGHLRYINSRSNNVLRSQIARSIRSVDFNITTASPLTVNGSTATISGDGWIDVRNIRINGGGDLDATWTDGDSWQVTVPVLPGANTITLQAVNFSGTVIDTKTITVNNTSTIEPASRHNLAISEFMYHPSAPTTAEIDAGFPDKDLFEFIELMNIGTREVSLDGARFTSGISHALPAVTITPGARIVLARNRAAFLNRYPGSGATLLQGDYAIGDTNKLSNDGEPITLTASGGTDIRRFTYNDQQPWPTSADGAGFSLVLIAPGSNPEHSQAANWRSSGSVGGTPGSAEATTFSGNPDADDDGDGLSNFLDYTFGNSPRPAFSTAAGGALVFELHRNLLAEDVIITVESSSDLINWDPTGVIPHSAASLGDGLELQTWHLDPATVQPLFLRVNATQR
ncbi:MAG: lamin tail domain-containing protein, partial [Verrucomicrobiales bacterium]|nr:lamin tail domain-containing protein [Verrucomicrobiales bacterium]